MNWLIPANSKQYDFISAFDELKTLDWTKRANYDLRDIVYIYGSKPFQKIIYKTEVIGIDIKSENTINDIKYWRTNQTENKPLDTLYVRLKVLTKYNDDRFSLDKLKVNGLKVAPQGPIKIKDNLLSFIELIDTDNIFSHEEANYSKLSETEKDAIFKARIGQGYYRDRLIKKENGCKICGISNVNLLIASHIKPWALSNDIERLDINNGLLLCPNHDALFDKGFISFTEEGNILITEEIDSDTKELLSISDDIKLVFNKEEKRYIKFHRENIYRNKLDF